MTLPVTLIALAGCTATGFKELSPEFQAQFGFTHSITVNADRIDDLHSGSARALELAQEACGLPTRPLAKEVRLTLSQALGAGRLFVIQCP